MREGSDDYFRVYEKVLSHVKKPVILHWLGEVFDPHLPTYWGYKDQDAAMKVCLDLITNLSEKVDGIKISLLDPEARGYNEEFVATRCAHVYRGRFSLS